MSRLLSQLAAEVGRLAAEACRGVLPAPPTVLVEPPSHDAEYPAVAVMIDDYVVVGSLDEEIETDEDDEMLFGSTARLEGGTLFELAPGTQLACAGTIRAKGKIWVGARYPSKREDMEEAILAIFYADGSMPGVLRATLRTPKVGEHTLPWDLEVAAFAGDDNGRVRWQAEPVFTERLSSELPIAMDVPFLLPRNSPTAQTLLLALSHDLDADVSTPADLADLLDIETVTVNADGTVGTAP